MMLKRFRLALILLALAVSAAILAQVPGAPTRVTVRAPGVLTVTPSTWALVVGETKQFTSSGGNGTNWSSSNNAVATVSGSGLVTGVSAGTVTILARKGNQNGVATVTVSACTFGASPSSLDYSSAGGTQQISLTASPSACGWTASDNAAWLTLGPSIGTGSATIDVVVAANTGSARSATVTVAGQSVSVNQDAGGGGSDPSCTVTTDGSFSDTQAKVDASSDGDVVCLPSGTLTWMGESAVLNVTNKNIWIKGAGVDTTTLTMATDGSGTPNYAFFVRISNGSHGNFRISHLTIAGTIDSGAVIGVFANTYSGVLAQRWRIDHVKFALTAGYTPTGIVVQGIAYGLVDHLEANPWAGGILFRGTMFVEDDFLGSPHLEGDLINTQPTDYGTDKFVVVEDSTVNFDWQYGNSIVFDASSGGGRFVFRNNTFTDALIYNHWTRSNALSAQVIEVYRNTFTGTTGSGGDPGWNDYLGQYEAGTGVVWGNQVTGYGATQSWLFTERRGAGEETSADLLGCNGARAWDGNVEASGWPCLGQIGRAPGKSFATIIGGSKQASEPFHFWSNGQESTCKTGGTCTDELSVFVATQYANLIKATAHTNGDVDYIRSGNTPKAGYTPLAYPHHRQTDAWPY